MKFYLLAFISKLSMRSFILFLFICCFKLISYGQPEPFAIAAVETDSGWGYINTQGAFVIKPSFKSAKNFSEGFAPVKVNSKWAYINTEGVLTTKVMFSFAGCFIQNRARVEFNQKWGYIDTTGEIVLKGIFQEATDFNDGYAMVKINDLWGIINLKGEFIIPCKYKRLKNFTQNRAIVMIDGKYGYLDHNNTLVIKNLYVKADYFSSGLAKVRDEVGYMFIDTTGKIVIDLRDIVYTREDMISKGKEPFAVGYLKESRFFAMGNAFDKYALYDSVGRQLTTNKFLGYRSFSEGLAAVSYDTKEWGYIDKEGNFSIKPSYSNVRDFSFGYAPAEFANLWGYIDKQGSIKIFPRFKKCNPFVNPYSTIEDKFD